MAKINPKISIITICYNCAELIEGTIKSVLEQSYKNIEYIIIDGASSDGTLEIVNKYQSQIDKILSEKDEGIYDAMNKGLSLATGDFVWFMNAGDRILVSSTVENMVNGVNESTDLIYGEIVLVDNERNQLGKRSELTPHLLPKELQWQDMKHGMVVSHQAFLPAMDLCPKYIDQNLSADIDWVIKCLKKANGVHHTNTVLAEYLMGGQSKQQHNKSLLGRYKILQSHFGILNNFFNHIFIFIRAIFFKIKRLGKKSY